VIAAVLALILECGTPSLARSQNLAAGIKTGGQLLSQFTGSEVVSNSSRLVVGPSLEVAVKRGFALEISALLKQLNNHSQGRMLAPCKCVLQINDLDTTAHAWEFPLVLKKYINVRSNVRVFPAIGVSLRHTTGDTRFQTTFESGCSFCQPSSGTVNPSSVLNPWSAGPVMGAGVDLHMGLLHFQPELRYAIWTRRALIAVSNQYAVDILAGFSFGR